VGVRLRGNVFAEPLLRNGRHIFAYLQSNGCYVVGFEVFAQ
jgi:hypothetical protein